MHDLFFKTVHFKQSFKCGTHLNFFNKTLFNLLIEGTCFRQELYTYYRLFTCNIDTITGSSHIVQC
jgi:hypothetical protein